VEDRKEGMAGEKILCVDDEGPIRKLCTVYLGKRGYRVEAVANGVEALKLIESKGPPDLVVTDVNMPLMNGLELVKRLREDRRTARTPIIVLSGAKQEQDILAGYSHGADDYIGKPIDLSVLTAKIETILRRRGARHRRQGRRLARPQPAIRQRRDVLRPAAPHIDRRLRAG
jgi:DNA-binding response OmpR family regulator